MTSNWCISTFGIESLIEATEVALSQINTAMLLHGAPTCLLEWQEAYERRRLSLGSLLARKTGRMVRSA